MKKDLFKNIIQRKFKKDNTINWIPQRTIMYLKIIILVVLSTSIVQCTTNTSCAKKGVTLQILGSGGPFAGDCRASSGYLVWAKGRPLVMIDAGGGTYLRLQQAEARIGDIKLIGISHFHPDHASDLPALLWSDFYNTRSSPLVVSGPSGEGAAGLKGFLNVLNKMIYPTNAFSRVSQVEVEPDKDSPINIYKDSEVEVTAIGVNHLVLPTLAYKVKINNISIGFGSDQLLDNPAFTKFVQGVDILVLHLAVSEDADAVSNIHAKPSVVGKIAHEAGVSTLVLSHFIKLDPSNKFSNWFSLHDLGKNLSFVKKHYTGNVILAEDLQCIEVNK